MQATLPKTLLLNVARRGDLAFALLVVVAVMMMIIPLPTALVDVLIACNIAASTLILLVAFYIKRATDLSSLPTIVLMAALFRIALSITTTRLILLQGDAGETVEAFGTFVIGGNVAVGLIVFLIITVAQFVVITKGAERVAEVGARFTLDALPGKQMNIDNDLRSGAIDQAEAQRRRSLLERESQFYGAMDGSMKFVKGDAIAGLVVIIIINLLGGLTIGVLQRGMSLGEAAARYSLLTVGDGLISQIPALLVSMAAGTVVTRVGGDSDKDVGSAIFGQLSRDPRAFGLVAAVLAALALLPGFPTLIFLVLAAIFASGTWLMLRSTARAVAAAESLKATARALEPRLVLRLGPDLAAAIPAAPLTADIDSIRADLLKGIGLRLPNLAVRVDATLPGDAYSLDLDGTPEERGMMPADHLAVTASAMDLDLAGLPYEAERATQHHAETLWVPEAHRTALEAAGFATGERREILLQRVEQTLGNVAMHFLGLQETRNLLAQIEGEYGELVAEVQKVIPLQSLAELLRSLVAEQVPIRNLRLILEAIVEWAQYHREVITLEGFVRSALRRQICFRWADENRVIAAYVLEREIEDLVRTVLQQAFGSAAARNSLTLLATRIREHLQTPLSAPTPVVLTQRDVRLGLRQILLQEGLQLPVLAYDEIAPDYFVQTIATVTVGADGLLVLRAAAQSASGEAPPPEAGTGT
ncbi:MAG: type III secretion system export apparatus subunit SctV [Pseudomonadota bacterium]